MRSSSAGMAVEMEPNCIGITRRILPAVRASVAEVMKERYNYTEAEIAQRLGVVQVTVSKYLNKRYSSDVESMKSYIMKNNLNAGIVEDIRTGKDAGKVNERIDELCAAIASR